MPFRGSSKTVHALGNNAEYDALDAGTDHSHPDNVLAFPASNIESTFEYTFPSILTLTENWLTNTTLWTYLPGCSDHLLKSPRKPRPIEPDPTPPSGHPV